MIPAVVLAAGRSSRMGRPKATLPIGSETFLSRIVRTLHEAGVDEVVVVLGHEADRIRAELAPLALPARIVVNAAYDEGQLSSLHAALEVIDRPGVRAMLMTPVDVPLFSASTARAVVERYRATQAVVVRPVSGERHGHPVLIDRSLFGALRSADRAAGAKPIVRRHASSAGDVPVDDDGAFIDIDTGADYDRLISRAGGADRSPNASR